MKHLQEIHRFQKIAGINKRSLLFEESEEFKKYNQLAGNTKSTDKEETSKQDIPDEVSKAASVFDLKAIKKQAKEKAETLDEVLDPLSWVGIVLAIPALLQGLATLIEKANRQFKKLPKEEIEKLKAHNVAVAKGEIEGHKKYTSEVSKEIDEYAHWLHKMMVAPIEGVFWIISKIPFIGKKFKDQKIRHKWAEGIYLLTALFIGAYGLLSHAIGVTTAIDSGKLADVVVDADALVDLSAASPTVTKFSKKSARDMFLKLVA